ncbi:MAG TPA: type II secretion system F family protein [Vicinamibacterales bacterium]|nr:type II secretion system F family protein [Vicinamibacterales bacterium]
MTLLLPLLAFAFASLLVTAAAMALAPTAETSLERRLGEVTGSAGRAEEEETGYSKNLIGTMKRLGAIAPKASAAETTKLRQRLVCAGYRNSEALVVFMGIRVSTAIGAFLLFATPLVMEPNLSMALVGALLGYVLPGMLLARIAKKRQHKIRLGLPDALDLLVVSVEAGLGLDQAILKVSEELAFAHPELCGELRLINLELRAGTARSDALHNLAERTGVDDISSLVAMLVQTDKFGTSVAQSLRVHSDTVRTKRRQRAEEAAAKTGVKMVFPLVFCIFPAIWVVTIGPAVIKFVEVLGPMTNK